MTWQEKVFPMFNLTPPGKGPEVKEAEWVEGRPSQSTEKEGVVRITIGPDEPWSGLVAPGTVAPGWYETFKGGAHVVVGE